MKKTIIYLILLSLTVLSCRNEKNQNIPEENPRIIITTDIGGDPDDKQSLIRLLMYSDQFDIEALIASSTGTPGDSLQPSVRKDLIVECIQAYSKVESNLKLHSAGYPDSDDLLSRVKGGNPLRGLENTGTGHETEASAFITEIVDRKDNGKVNICIWGGQTDVVQALRSVKAERKHEDYLEFISRIRIFDIGDQDGLYSFIRHEFPELFYILSKSPEGVDKREAAFRGMYLGGNEALTSTEWLDRNVLTGHGPAGRLYPFKTWTSPNPHGAMKEGDTPSWFFFLPLALQDSDHPDWGGWGGRFEKDSAGFYRDAKDFAGGDIHSRATVYRWREYYQNDFAARMDWCVSGPDKANHSPVVEISGDQSNKPLIIKASVGAKVVLDASGSYDVDKNELMFYWWTYPEAGSNHTCPELENYLDPIVSFQIPEGEEGKEIHLICEVNDNGEPVLTSFKRVIIQVNN